MKMQWIVVLFCALLGVSAEGSSLSRDLQKEGLTAFQGHFSPIPVFNAHEVFYSSDLKERVFLRFDLPEGKIPGAEGDFLPLVDDDYLVYLRDRRHQRYAVIFSNLDHARRVRIKNKIESFFKKETPSLESVSNWLLPKAGAEGLGSASCAVNAGLLPSGIKSAGAALTDQEEVRALFRVLSGCTSGFFQGLWDATGGMVTGVAKGAYGLVTDPVGTWKSMKSGFEKAYDFILHFQSSMKKLGSAFQNLPLQAKSELLCSFISSIGAGVALTIFTAGAGAGELAAELTSYLGRLVKLEGFLSYFSKLGDLKALLGEKFLGALAKGGISAERLETIETFAHEGIPELAKQAAQCGL